jgi:hypothetical protein
MAVWCRSCFARNADDDETINGDDSELLLYADRHPVLAAPRQSDMEPKRN